FDWDLEPTGVRQQYGEKTAEELEALGRKLRVPGRVRSVRRQGKLIFSDIHDGKEKLQLFIRLADVPEAARTVLENLDLGDIVGASGTLMRTRAGELSLKVDDLELLSKAVRPLPEKWHGLADVETRYRQRYLDLATNEESRRVFEVRAAVVKGIREFLDARGFLEVETPMMQVIPGGATARPFKTHHNALDMDLYLRIAPELYLKRLLVGGIPRVYEINRNFRNEGISTRHNPEFTMLEFYWAYADYQQMMDLTEELLSGLAERARALQGKDQLTWEERPIDLIRPWKRLTLREAITHYAGIPAERLESKESVRAVLEEKGLEIPPGGTYGHLLMGLFEDTVEEHLFAPVFITEHPTDVSPLSKQRPDDPRFTERFELYIAGMEVANAFSELNDPDVQAERFRQQVAAREAGDAEGHLYDADYVRALEHAMPPAAGIGIGIDRLTMLLTDRQSIRDVILFPLMRPEAGE
ncbi:MAG TPA: lysine--tRNA ligase, partial [Thermoanaerobaculia bacterium]